MKMLYFLLFSAHQQAKPNIYFYPASQQSPPFQHIYLIKCIDNPFLSLFRSILVMNHYDFSHCTQESKKNKHNIMLWANSCFDKSQTSQDQICYF